MKMNLKNIALLTGLGIAVASLTPAAASAAVNGWTTRGATQHAGPGNQYPPVGFVPGGSPVRIFGCLRGVTQCDVSWRGNRGWVNGRVLAGFYKNKRVPLIGFGPQIGLPFITFNFGYWDDHYRGKPFFKQRAKWDKNWKDNDGPRMGGSKGPRMGDNDGPRMGDGKGPKDCKPGQMGKDCKPQKPM